MAIFAGRLGEACEASIFRIKTQYDSKSTNQQEIQ